MGFSSENKLLSIVTVSFNSENTIKETIESVLNQKKSNFEYIIIDGNSTDNTLEIIKKYERRFKEKKISYKWVSEKDTGIYDAFNKGVKLAKGEWISFLGSDDVYQKDALENYQTTINNLQEKVDFIHSEVKVGKKKIIKGKWSWRVFRRSMNIAHVGGFHHKNYFKKYGVFDTSYKIAGDYELLLRARHQLKTVKFDKITVVMGDQGISNNAVKKVYIETTRAKIKTAKVSKTIAKLDFYKWVLKYQIKKTIDALTR